VFLRFFWLYKLINTSKYENNDSAMILNEKILNISQKVANLENQEDRDSQLSRYLEMFEKGWVILDKDILNKIIDPELSANPVTPYASISLIRHIKKSNIDLKQLGKTSANLVRFLDGCIDIINLNLSAREKVSDYRKIGINFSDFENYCLIQKEEQQDAAKTIGEIVSINAYRSSEFLATTRGEFLKWSEIEKQYKYKVFNAYRNILSGDVLDGLEFKKRFNTNSFKSKDYTQIPRRNSHILLFSSLEFWYPYSDRVDSTNDRSLESDQIINQKNSLKKTNNPFELLILEEYNNQNNNHDSSISSNTNNQIDYNFIYKVGDLVEVNAPNEDAGLIFEVINRTALLDKKTYTLRGANPKHIKIKEEVDIKPLPVKTIFELQQNHQNFQKNLTAAIAISNQNQTSNQNKLKAFAFVFNIQEDKLLIDPSTKALFEVEISNSLTTEQQLIDKIANAYNLSPDSHYLETLDELGSCYTNKTLSVGYWINLESKNQKNLENELNYKSLDSFDNQPEINLIINKYKRRKKIFEQYDSIIYNLETERQKLQKEFYDLQTTKVLVESKPISSDKKNIVDRIVGFFNEEGRLTTKLNQIPTKQNEQWNKSQLELADGVREVSSFSLSLQQKIQTEDFGTVNISYSYTTRGLSSLAMFPEKIDYNNRINLDLYLDVVNGCLEIGVTKEQLIYLFSKYLKIDQDNSLLNLIKILYQSLVLAPTNLGEI
jgi:hypothetical protein